MSVPAAATWVSLVTGCSTGIGRALARELTRRGQRCFATARRADSVRELEAEGLLAVRLDVDDPVGVRAAVDAVLERAGRIDLLVNNAGQSLFGPLAELPLERIDALYRTDLRGPLAVAQAVVPAMAKQGWGRIANVGSMVGVVPTPWTGAYCAMKAALHTLSEVLRVEVAPLGIEVIVVQPGAVRSEVANNAPVDLERYATPDSLAAQPDRSGRLRAFARRRAHATARAARGADRPRHGFPAAARGATRRVARPSIRESVRTNRPGPVIAGARAPRARTSWSAIRSVARAPGCCSCAGGPRSGRSRARRR
jgi:NAD(P)-dependent dehydrogenase (short-subunit alcohol dehydrogenase family)